MLCDTVSLSVGAPAREAFAFLSTPENLPHWAVPFCQELSRRKDGFWVRTPDEILAFEMASDESTGAVDLRFGPRRERLVTYPMRVIPTGPERCLVTFTAWQLPGMPEEDFLGVVGGLLQELELLKEHVERRP